MLPSQRLVRKRLVLDQIPILWKVKCLGEREEMDSHLVNFGLLSGGMGLVFFFIASAPNFFKKMIHTPL